MAVDTGWAGGRLLPAPCLSPVPCPQVTITVLDENDNSPQFDITSDSSVSVAEDSAVGKRVAVVLARDPDAGSNGQVGRPEQQVWGCLRGCGSVSPRPKCLHRCLPNPFPSPASLRKQTLVVDASGAGDVCAVGTSAPWSRCACRRGKPSSLGCLGQRALWDTCPKEPSNLKTSCGLSHHGERQRSPWQAEQEALCRLLFSLPCRQALTRSCLLSLQFLSEVSQAKSCSRWQGWKSRGTLL